MPRFKYKPLKILKTFCLLVGLSILTTLASYAIITARNVPMRQDYVASGTTSITGEYLVTLPCVGPEGYDSAAPILPEARGVPFNFNYYTPCEGNVMLMNGFLLNFGFWLLVFACLYVGHRMYRRIRSKDQSMRSSDMV